MASRSNASSPGRSGGSAAPGTASGDASPDARPTASAVVGVPAFQWLGRGKRRGGVTEYRGFRADTHFVALGDVVMLDPGPGESEPFVGWVTRLFEASDGQMMMRAQWFFRKQDCYEWLAPPGKRPEANSPAGRILAAALDNELFASNQEEDNPVQSYIGRAQVAFPRAGVAVRGIRTEQTAFVCNYELDLQSRAFKLLRSRAILQQLLAQQSEREVLRAELVAQLFALRLAPYAIGDEDAADDVDPGVRRIVPLRADGSVPRPGAGEGESRTAVSALLEAPETKDGTATATAAAAATGEGGRRR
ncbi:hypothetical protein FNF27_06813 [Cafeteria roenbergensis]|uniref:BAH domain-containing protein n=2 Tax=Cafeteria roenbergensis TaxID=33653 RepID=A0A5A8E1U9_CAFRO|nr:hypothetical protein FNF27_06813 [Cafeteria roenbergensis]